MQVLEIKEEIFDFSLDIIEEKPYVLPCVNNNIPDDILNNSSYIDLFEVHQLISVQEGESSINSKPQWHLEVNKFIKDKNTLKVLFLCKNCNRVEEDLSKHTIKCKICDKNVTFICSHCCKEYDFFDSLRYHIEQKVCKRNIVYKCKLCDFTTKIENSLQKHVNCHRLRCSSCGKTYKKEQWLRVHKKYCGKQPNLSCEHCPYRTKFIGSLRTHLMKHEKININNDYNIIVENDQKMISKLFCDVCKNVTTYEENIKYKNCEKCDVRLDFYCTKCKNQYKNLRSIAHHLKIECEPKVKLNECKKCGKIAKTLNSLKMHEKYCGASTSLSCDLCSFKTKYQCSYRLHMKRHLNRTERIKNRIERVNNSCVHPALLNSYASFVDLYKRYCKACNKVIDSNFKNKRVCEICSNNYIFICVKCEGEFSRYDTLLYHLKFKCPTSPNKICIRKKSYYCDYCSFVTKIRRIAVRHIKKHKNINVKYDSHKKLIDENNSSTRKIIKKNSSSFLRYCSNCKITSDVTTKTKSNKVCPCCGTRYCFRCLKCKKTYKCFISIINHEKNCNKSKRKKSSYKRCQRLTKNDCRSAARATNKLRVAEEDLYRRFCDKCKDTGDSASEICKNCQNETMLQCSGCQKQIKRYAAMIFHLRHCSCNRDISQNCCSECDFIAVNKARLKKHLNEKHNNIN
ncbi:zinc finger protein 62-like isoform X2 [Trichogramma pretiosum]|uniref:zinc finger protein 62-like isoform X2 n=1 Tax=Trichogramma pretiosum TaxID=7493 RepID=UPI000C71947E|nr:zinc finger protein 62-like isoform X2 [Trichogramma pretiosum]